eukprot:TRINITY_DN69287_c0_g1_i1.p1 TRINITY_DN69287_c0_g1~~TRINITY_DN69287_c0_g1_i1.p1  ORF type:complete len:139 (-),score=20.22 TRINITY_DN69287_c0_g1_i1:122-508(-)
MISSCFRFLLLNRSAFFGAIPACFVEQTLAASLGRVRCWWLMHGPCWQRRCLSMGIHGCTRAAMQATFVVDVSEDKGVIGIQDVATSVFRTISGGREKERERRIVQQRFRKYPTQLWRDGRKRCVSIE